jgi:hypothetical protein
MKISGGKARFRVGPGHSHSHSPDYLQGPREVCRLLHGLAQRCCNRLFLDQERVIDELEIEHTFCKEGQRTL